MIVTALPYTPSSNHFQCKLENFCIEMTLLIEFIDTNSTLGCERIWVSLYVPRDTGFL